MVNKFSIEWYRTRVRTVIANYGANTKRRKELLELLNDSRLRAIDKQLVSRYQEMEAAVDRAPNNPDCWLARNAAAKAVSESPWRALQWFLDRLPLENMFPLAIESSAVRNLFLDKLRDVDAQNRAVAHSAQHSMKHFINSLYNDVVPRRRALPDKGQVAESTTKDIPHPLGAILRRSKAGGGRLGSTTLAKELDTYCTQQLLDYIKHSQRAKKPLSGQPTSVHLGKVHVIGILTTIFNPRKASNRLKDAMEKIEEGTTKLIFQITNKEIEVFLKKPHVVAYLDSLQ